MRDLNKSITIFWGYSLLFDLAPRRTPRAARSANSGLEPFIFTWITGRTKKNMNFCEKKTVPWANFEVWPWTGGFIIYFLPFSSKIDLMFYCKHIFEEQNKIHLSVIFIKKGRIVSTFWTSFIHNFVWFSETQIVRLNKIRDLSWTNQWTLTNRPVEIKINFGVG